MKKVKIPQIQKFETSLEFYTIKKLVYDLSGKFKRNDIAMQIKLEIENADLNWIDHL